MLKNYLKIALRALRKEKVYAAINIFSLALGLAVCLLILLYVRAELSFDRFHDDAERTYRIVRQEADLPASVTPPAPLAPALAEAYPEVEHATRLFRFWFTPLVSRADDGFYERDLLFTDPAFFDVFDFPLVAGDPATALDAPFSILLTETTARKYFGEEDPLGQTLTVNAEHTYTVTGVVEDPPRTSHFQFDLLAPLAGAEAVMNWPGALEEWGLGAFNTYVVLPEGYDPARFDEQLVDFARRQFGEETTFRFFLQPLTDIHLHSAYGGELGANSDVRYVWMLAGLALVILLLACINYANLATARFARRAREVGVRKVVGAARRQLVAQFLGESLLMAFVALLFGLALLELLLVGFSLLMGEALAFSYADDAAFVMLALALALGAGLAAGSYPAFYLSSFRPGIVLKGSAGPRRAPLRTVLVVAQYAIAVVLIAGTGIIYRQLDYIQTKQLGFEKEQMLVVPVRDDAVRARPEAARAAFLGLPEVTHVAATTSLPGTQFPGTTDVQRAGATDDKPFRMSMAWGDADYLETLGMSLVAGRTFSEERPADMQESVLLNATAARRLGFATPEAALGEALEFWGQTRTVVGVVGDFHFDSLREPIAPLLVMPEMSQAFGLVLRLRTDDLPAALARVGDAWKTLSTAQPFTYSFLDDDLAGLYDADIRWGRLIGSAALFALLIASLGLFGLASFAAQQRTKEIGIRKVMGASAARIALLLSGDFTRLVVVAFVIGTPVALFAAQQWLGGFAYRVTLAQCAGIFAAAGLLALLIAGLTVSIQAVRAARADPVKSLRYE